MGDAAIREMRGKPFNPRLLLFQCRFNHYSEADVEIPVGSEAVEVKRIQVPCAGRISPLLLLNAVQGGVDGILVCGCRPGRCHFKQGNLGSRRQLAAFRELLVYVGMAPQRLRFLWLDPAERGRLHREVTDFSERIRTLGRARHPAVRRVSDHLTGKD